MSIKAIKIEKCECIMRKNSVLILVLIMSFLITSCNISEDIEYTATGFQLNTYVSVTLKKGGSQTIADHALELCDYYEKIFSCQMEESLLYQLNKEGSMKIETEEEQILLELLQIGIDYGDLTNGGLDITIEPLSTLWGFGTENEKLPEENEIIDAIENVDYKKIEINDNYVDLNGTQVDLGAIAKGYIADRIKEYLETQGVTSAIINLGGNILCLGEKPDKSDFVIGIQKPFGDGNDVVFGLSIQDMSVVTSGVYERYFYSEDNFYHHILDPSTGYPCENDILSVTIISKESTICDCLSTGCFVMGIDEAMNLVNNIEGVEMIIIDNNNEIFYSAGAADLVVE